jgi:hypothetical protein
MLRSGFVALALALTASATGSCALPTQDKAKGGPVPDKASFVDNGVSTFMERRCGSLDCHGQPGRPLRLYSEWGLRLKAKEDGSRDSSQTTEDEQNENYLSVVGLEPENLARCYKTKGEDRATFQLLQKPLGIEGGGIRHKGGAVIRDTQSDPGWLCLFGWASGGEVDKDQCAQGAKVQ